MKKFLLLMPLALLVACTDSKGAVQAIENSGLQPVSTDGYAFFGCGKDDQFHTKFTAKRTSDGKIVTGVVCKGFLKGSTVRFD